MCRHSCRLMLPIPVDNGNSQTPKLTKNFKGNSFCPICVISAKNSKTLISPNVIRLLRWTNLVWLIFLRNGFVWGVSPQLDSFWCHSVQKGFSALNYFLPQKIDIFLKLFFVKFLAQYLLRGLPDSKNVLGCPVGPLVRTWCRNKHTDRHYCIIYIDIYMYMYMYFNAIINV